MRRFPSVSVFNVDDLLGQVRSIIDKALAAVQSVFLFTLFAGLVVLIAAVQASREERRYESAMLRTLGASRSTVLKGLLAEFAALGVLSGTLAATGASIAGSLHRQSRAADSVYARSMGMVLRPGGRWIAGLPGGLAGHAFGGEPTAGAHAAGRVMTNCANRAAPFDGGLVRPARARALGVPDRHRQHLRPPFGYTTHRSAGQPAADRVRLFTRRQGDFWLDYVADIGDGWNPTYAIADAIARPELEVEHTAAVKPRAPATCWYSVATRSIPYPVAQRIRRAHRDALRASRSRAGRVPRCLPFRATTTGTTAWWRFHAPSAGRSAALPAARRARRAAISRCRLPANWWLLAIDLQLGADLDEPQVQYFQKVAARMDDAARLIFCVPEPRWILEDAYPSHTSYEELSSTRFLEEKVFRRKARVFLTGDLHFYKRHENADGRAEDHLGRRRRVPASHACARHHAICAMASRNARCIPTRRPRGAWRGAIFCFRCMNPKAGWLYAFLYAMSAWLASASLEASDVIDMPHRARRRGQRGDS